MPKKLIFPLLLGTIAIAASVWLNGGSGANFYPVGQVATWYEGYFPHEPFQDHSDGQSVFWAEDGNSTFAFAVEILDKPATDAELSEFMSQEAVVAEAASLAAENPHAETEVVETTRDRLLGLDGWTVDMLAANNTRYKILIVADSRKILAISYWAPGEEFSPEKWRAFRNSFRSLRES